ncbi:hypothetical protein GCM10022224_047190 [Nonomuraea antimicrobica]|uniref:VOC domain-containing protein n=1 Tax=Nonomuraea antimicrobica TaxID=561173 RepID=A0ABP7C550_9ACTN
MSLTSSPSFDHLIHVVPDVPRAATAYDAAGFRTYTAEPAFGAQNGSWLDDLRYVELYTVLNREEWVSNMYAPWSRQVVSTVEDMMAAGGGAFAMGFEVPEIARATERMRSAGVAAEVIMIDLPRGDRKVSYPLAFPTEGPRWTPFLLTYPGEPEQRRALTRSLGRRPSGFGIDHLVVETADPREGARWLAAILGLPDAIPVGADWRLAVPGADLVFTAGPAERVTTVGLTGPDVPDVTLFGLRYRSVRR